jgi:tetratricopeptide (TPR) repeat protein
MAGQWDKAENYYHQAIDIAKRQNELQWQTVGSCGLGNIYLNRGNVIQALKLYSQILGPVEQNGDKKLLAMIYDGVGLAFCMQGNYSMVSLQESAA